MVELTNIANLFPLQNYTTFSLLSGTMEPEKWAENVAGKGFKYAGICDKQTLGGTIEFQKACKKFGIKPIIGCEFLVADKLGKTASKDGATKGVILLYAASRKGAKNLIALNNFSHRRSGGFHWFPRLSPEYLENNLNLLEDVICVVPVFEGYGLTVGDLDLSVFKKSLDPNDLSFDLDKISKLRELFGKNFFIALNPLKDRLSLKNLNIGTKDKLYCENLIFRDFNRMAANFPVKKIFTFDSHYLNKEDFNLYYNISKVKKGSSKGSRECKYRDVYNGFVPTLEQFQEAIQEMIDFDCFDNPPSISKEDVEECLINMGELLNTIDKDANFETGVPKLPIPLSEDPEADIISFIFKGFKENLYPEADIEGCKSIDDLDKFRFDNIYPFEHVAKGESIDILKPLTYYVDQLKHEFSIIKKLNFIDYFWFVRDITAFVDSIGATRGPARGSAAGALISYVIGITLLDPVRHDLSFERFLNEDRNDLPDIDLDFSKESVAMVREYIKNKYGVELFCRICNYGRLKVVSAIKDIAKAWDYGIKDEDGITRNYNFTYINSLTANTFVKATLRGIDELNERIEMSEDFANFVETHKSWIYETVMPLLESISSNGIHASGNLILPEELDNCLPIIEKSEIGYVSQWCDVDCEAAGFPKFDFLVIDGADIITYMIQLIKEEMPDEKVPTIKEIPLDDYQTLKSFQQAKTEGIFQYKTFSYKRLLKRFIVDRFDVLTILGAVNRPGPISANVPQDMANTQHGKRPLTYDHEDLTPILKESYGFMIYQEQMMKIVQVLAGLDGKQADHVRKACGKKKPEDMKKWESVVIDGMLARGYSREFAEDMWFKIVAFSDYSFNKSHSVSYALIAYYQMYLKVRYPLQYWAAVMQFASSDADKDTSIFKVRIAAESEGIKFKFPTIDYFDDRFYPVKGEENTIVWPLTAIKDVGVKAVEAMCYDLKSLKKSDEIEEKDNNSEDTENNEAVITRHDLPKRRSFKSMSDMLENVMLKNVDKRVCHALIRAGFFEPEIENPYEALLAYYDYRRDVLKKKNETIPFEMDHENLFEWQLQKNKAFDMIVSSWKYFAEFSDNCVMIPEDKFDNIMNKRFEDGSKFIIGGYVENINSRRDRSNNHYAIIEIVDYNEKYTVFLWSGFWMDKNLDYNETRPKKGQLIELEVTKKTHNERPQLSVSKEGSYVKIICDAVEFDED